NRDGAGDIYVMNSDGSGVHRLTKGLDAANAAWSPDGKTIAFVGDREGKADIYLMNADGSGQHDVTPGAGVDDFPAWLPGGSKISFVRVVHGKAGIYVMSADGTDQRLVLQDAKDFIGGYSWSPDGRKLVFGSARDQAAGEIYVVNADGRGLRRLTKNRFGDNGPVW